MSFLELWLDRVDGDTSAFWTEKVEATLVENATEFLDGDTLNAFALLIARAASRAEDRNFIVNFTSSRSVKILLKMISAIAR